MTIDLGAKQPGMAFEDPPGSSLGDDGVAQSWPAFGYVLEVVHFQHFGHVMLTVVRNNAHSNCGQE